MFKLNKLSKKAKTLMITGAVVAMTVVPAFAETADVNTVMASSFNSVKDQVSSGVMTALPIALGIVALTFGIKYVVRFFKSVSRG